jgi:hypothetical protein
MSEKKFTRNRKSNQKKEEIAQVLEQCSDLGIVDAIAIRATQKKQKPKYYRRHSA